MNRNENGIVAKFYDRSTMAQLPDPSQIGRYIAVEDYDGANPGGFGSASLRVTCDATAALPFGESDFIKLFNGERVVWEGEIGRISHWFSAQGQGVRLMCTGPWGRWMSRTIEKRWADNRMTDDVWYEPATAFDGNDKTLSQVMQIDRVSGRIRFTPKNEAFAVNQYHRAEYAMPTGQTVKRVKCSYNMQEAAQAWVLGIYNTTAGAAIWSVSASGAGTRDDTLGTPSNKIWLYLQSGAAQTPTSDGVYYGQVDSAISGATAFMVYSETGNINCYEVFKDVAALVPELSTDYSLLDSTLSVSIEPFITKGREELASILARIAAFGTSTYGGISYGIRDSSQSTDGKPILFCEPTPPLTDYEWEINISDRRIGDTLEIVRDADSVVNWVVVEYEDALGKRYTITPDDDATLKDTDSIAKHGERHGQVLRLGQVGQTPALQYARSYLAKMKDTQVYVSGSITYRGSIPGKNGASTPASEAVVEVLHGVRARVSNFVTDVLDIAGAGLTALVSSATYSDVNGGEVRLTFGVPDDLATLLARMPIVHPSNYHVATRLRGGAI